MDAFERETIVNGLLSGIVCFSFDNKTYKIVNPTPEQTQLATFLSKQLSKDLNFGAILTKEESENLLAEQGIWTPEDDKKLEDSEKALEDLKVSLFEAMYNDRKKETIRTRIKGIRRATDEANKRKYSLFDKTLEHHMSLFRSKFLVGICIFDLSGKRMFDESSVLDSSSALSEIAYNEWEKNIITPEQFREVARTSPWTSYWSPFKEGVFGVSASHLNDKQRTIVMFSKMYDNAHQSMECPPDEVFEDDDMFDGWMIKERRDGEKTRKQKRADNSFDSKHSNAGEVFFSAESQNEANKIIDLNEFGEKMRLRRRSRELEVSEGPVKEQELTDVKMKLRRQLIEEVTNKK